MDEMPLAASSSIFGRSALVVTSDQAVASQLEGLLANDHACQASLAETYQDAEQFLQRNAQNSVFIDLRRNSHDDSPVPLLEHLARRNGNRMAVIAITDEGYVREWAALADSAIHGHLRLPLDRRQLSSLSQRETNALSRCRLLSRTAPRLIQGRTLQYRTYTPEMFQMLDHLVVVADHDVTLLLVGETGTGKTTIAKLVHELSSRSQDKFLTVACGALPPDLIESELFGHVKGAFTSADRTKVGKFEVAGSGTLLLDEIDVLGPDQQAKLLRIIETGEFEPVGSNETRHSQARLIVASNVDLQQLMERGDFRADLYYRLNVLEFQILPLRKRPMDIVPLSLGFVEEFCTAHNVAIRRIDPEFLSRLKDYDWPGNIRELKNHIRRAVLFSTNGELTPRDLAPAVLQAGQINGSTRDPETLSEKVACSEQEILAAALRANDFKRTTTAQSLGISRVGLYKKMKKYGMLDGKPRLRKSTNGHFKHPPTNGEA
jgi:DNA-binding NtrC family response regulator